MADTKKYIKRYKESDGTLRYFKDEDARNDISGIQSLLSQVKIDSNGHLIMGV